MVKGRIMLIGGVLVVDESKGEEGKHEILGANSKEKNRKRFISSKRSSSVSGP